MTAQVERRDDADLPVRVLVVDDHRTFAEVLAMRLGAEPDIDVVGVAFSVPQAEAMVAKSRPDIVLLDLLMGQESGLGLLSALAARSSRPEVVMVSGVEDVAGVVDSLDAGARAWVPKDSSVDDLLTAIRSGVEGRMWLPPDLLAPVIQELLDEARRSSGPSSFLDRLSARQIEVLRCLVAGMTRAEVAERLVLSPNTVRTHIQNVLRETGAHSTLAAVAMARDAGLPGIDEPLRARGGRPQRWPV
jgi:two-component system nitrate/nitrite response regulator NarL